MTAKVLEQAELPTEVVPIRVVGESVTDKPTAVALPNESVQVMDMFRRAFEGGGANPEALAKLIELKDKIERRNAELQYAGALARFQQECPPVPPDAEMAHLQRVGRDGVKRAVKYATIQGLRDHMTPYLIANGFSLHFPGGSTEGEMLTASCELTHANGHSRTSKFTLPTRSASPAMSPQQAYEAAYSFACRIALRSVTGVRVASDDVQAEQESDPTTITEEQVANLAALLDEVKMDRQKFLAWQGVSALSEIPARRYARAVAAVEAKRKAT